MVCSSPQWEISGNALGLSEFAGMGGWLGLFFLTISALGLFHPLQEVKYVPSNEIFFFVSLSARFKGAEMLGSFCLPFGKEKCSPQIPAALLVSEICPELQPGEQLSSGQNEYKHTGVCKPNKILHHK